MLSPEELHDLGYQFHYGIERTKNISQAIYYYECAAEKGFSKSMYNLGVAYSEQGNIHSSLSLLLMRKKLRQQPSFLRTT